MSNGNERARMQQGTLFKLGVLALLTFPLVAILSLRLTGAGDHWFLLLVGREVLESQKIPISEFFVYPGYGTPQRYYSAGFGVLLALVERSFGLSGISVLNGLLWGLVFTLGALAGAMRAINSGRSITYSNYVLALIVICLVYIVVATRTYIRSEVSLYISWMLAWLIFELSIYRREPKIFLICFPVICWGQSWLQIGSHILLLILPIVWLYARGVDGLFRSKSAWAMCLLCATMLPLLNPNGLDQVAAVYKHTLDTVVGGARDNSVITKLGFEYQSILDATSIRLIPAFVIAAALLILLAAASRQLAKLTPEVFLAFIFLAFACFYVRGIGFVAMAVLVPLIYISFAIDVQPGRRQLIGWFILSVAFAGATSTVLRGNWGVQTSAPALAFVARAIDSAFSRPVNIFTDESGTQILYLARPGHKIAIGGHMTVANPAAIQHYLGGVLGAAEWTAQFERYDVRAVCVPYFHVGDDIVVSQAPYQLSIQQDWRLVATLPTCGLLLRTQGNMAVTPDYQQRLRYLHGMRDAAVLAATIDRRSMLARFVQQVELEIRGTQAAMSSSEPSSGSGAKVPGGAVPQAGSN